MLPNAIITVLLGLLVALMANGLVLNGLPRVKRDGGYGYGYGYSPYGYGGGNNAYLSGLLTGAALTGGRQTSSGTNTAAQLSALGLSGLAQPSVTGLGGVPYGYGRYSNYD